MIQQGPDFLRIGNKPHGGGLAAQASADDVEQADTDRQGHQHGQHAQEKRQGLNEAVQTREEGILHGLQKVAVKTGGKGPEHE